MAECTTLDGHHTARPEKSASFSSPTLPHPWLRAQPPLVHYLVGSTVPSKRCRSWLGKRPTILPPCFVRLQVNANRYIVEVIVTKIIKLTDCDASEKVLAFIRLNIECTARIAWVGVMDIAIIKFSPIIPPATILTTRAKCNTIEFDVVFAILRIGFINSVHAQNTKLKVSSNKLWLGSLRRASFHTEDFAVTDLVATSLDWPFAGRKLGAMRLCKKKSEKKPEILFFFPSSAAMLILRHIKCYRNSIGGMMESEEEIEAAISRLDRTGMDPYLLIATLQQPRDIAIKQIVDVFKVVPQHKLATMLNASTGSVSAVVQQLVERGELQRYFHRASQLGRPQVYLLVVGDQVKNVESVK